mgnify:CR=1 FL=1
MKLVIGGAYQGKQSYASKTYNLTNPDWKDGQTCTIEDLKTAKAVHHSTPSSAENSTKEDPSRISQKQYGKKTPICSS